MSKTVSNTLSRWHKIAERIKTAHAQLTAEILRYAKGGQGDAEVVAVKREVLESQTLRVFTDLLPQAELLQHTLCTIRDALATANVRYGVSTLLAEMEANRQALTLVEQVLQTTEGTLTPAEFDQLLVKRRPDTEHDPMRYGIAVNFINEAHRAALETKRQGLRLRGIQLADQLAEVNATKISIVVEDAVAELVGI